MRRLLGVAALIALGAAGCESFRSNVAPDRPTWVKRPGYALEVVAKRELTARTVTVGEAYERGAPTLDPEHMRLFVGSADRHFYALRADDLSTLWSFRTVGFVQSEPLYVPGDDVLYFGSNDGAIYKVRAADGELLWRFSTNAEVARRPVRHQGWLFATNANDTVVAVDEQSGALKWTYHRTPAQGMEIAGYAGVLVTGGRAITGFSDGHVIAFDEKTGVERWSLDLSAEAEQQVGDVPRYLDVDATPVAARVAGSQVAFVASYEGGVYGLDVETGSRLWANEQAKGVTELSIWEEPAHTPSTGPGPLVPARRMLLGSSGSTGLWAMALEDGRELWRKPLPEGGIQAPVPFDGALLVATTRYGLFLMSPDNGAVIDGIDIGSGFAQTPVAYGKRAFVMSNEGTLLSLHVDGPTRTPPREGSIYTPGWK